MGSKLRLGMTFGGGCTQLRTREKCLTDVKRGSISFRAMRANLKPANRNHQFLKPLQFCEVDPMKMEKIFVRGFFEQRNCDVLLNLVCLENKWVAPQKVNDLNKGLRNIKINAGRAKDWVLG